MPTPDRFEQLEERVRALEAAEEIRSLKALYAELTDARYGRKGIREPDEVDALAGRIAGLFTEDAVWEGGAALGECRGRDAIRARFAEPTLSFSWHFFVKPRIHVTGDRAEARWDVFAPCTTREGRAMWMTGVEDDEYHRVDGHWLHSRMRLRVIFMAPYNRGWSTTSGTSQLPDN